MNRITMPLSLLLGCALAVGCSGTQSATDSSVAAPTTVRPVADVNWEALNPARGDKSPKAATLWGDRNGSVPTGFLVQFVDGFSSPPHIHNVTYRGVVIDGLIHNDDPDAATMWMPAGSYWTQPAGEAHITAARGPRSIAYIEIGDGPYLVLPTDEAFDNGERPVNVHASNVIWLDHRGEAAAGDGPATAYLWGQPRPGQLRGTLLRLPAGFTGSLRPGDGGLRAVVIQGRPGLDGGAGRVDRMLDPGSFFAADQGTGVRISCEPGAACVLYVRAENSYDVAGAE